MLELAPGALIKFSKARREALISCINFWPQNGTIFISIVNQKGYIYKFKKRCRKLLFVNLETFSIRFRVARQKCQENETQTRMTLKNINFVLP